MTTKRSDSAPPNEPMRATRAVAPSAKPAATGVRVLCVDDHAVLIEGVKTQFAVSGGAHVVGALSSAADLLEEVERLRPDVVMLDVEMPGPDVFEMADRLRRKHPDVRFVFLSAHVRDGYLAAAYKCGAWGYFCKADDLEAIVAGVLKIASCENGAFVMGPKVRARCVVSTNAPSRANAASQSAPRLALQTLTAREIEVLRLIGKGRSRNEIAAELSRSAKTIDGHQERMMKKLGVSSRADLMRYAIREGLAEA